MPLTTEEQLALALVVKGVQKFESDMKKADQAVDKSGKSMEESGKKGITFGSSLKSLVKGFAMVGAGAAIVGATLKKAFDLGKQGAQVVQAEESFKGLNEQLELGAGYMDKLREAAGGTIPDLKLMAGMGTLVAGTSKDFGQQLAAAYPTLITYARAASKLNPHLGTTAQMLDSISLGIKRGSPMILDNLGIVVKVGEANKIYAEQIGKAVDALTAEEKSLALLNATMEAGGRLVEQVGGNVDSATDSFNRLETATTNLKNELLKKLVPTLSAAAEAFVLLLTMSDQIAKALEEQAERVLATSDTYPEYVKGILDSYVAARKLSRQQANQMIAWVAEGNELGKVAERYNLLTREQHRHEQATKDDRLQVGYLTGELETQVEITKSAAEELWVLTERKKDDRRVTVDWADAVEAAAKAEEKRAEATRELAIQTGKYFVEAIELEDGLVDLLITQGDLITVTASSAEAHDAARLATLKAEEAAGKLAKAQTALAENTDPEKQNALEAALLGARTAFNKADVAAGNLNSRLTEGYTYTADLADKIDEELNKALWESAEAAEWDAFQMATLAGELGNYTDEQIEAALKAAALKIVLDELAEAVANEELTVLEAVDAFERLKGAMDKIPSEKVLEFRWEAPQGPPPDWAYGYKEWWQGAGYQTGAWNIPAQQLAMLHPGEMVIPAGPAQQIRQMSQSTTINHNWNLTTQSLTRPGALAMEFEAMSMASR